MKYFDPKTVDPRENVRFQCFVIDRMYHNMRPHCDQYLMVYDLKDAGYANFSSGHVKESSAFMQCLFCDCQYKSIFIRQSWTINTLYGMIKPLLHPRTAAKFNFYGSDWKEKLLEDIELENIPVEYGGTNTNPYQLNPFWENDEFHIKWIINDI